MQDEDATFDAAAREALSDMRWPNPSSAVARLEAEELRDGLDWLAYWGSVRLRWVAWPLVIPGFVADNVGPLLNTLTLGLVGVLLIFAQVALFGPLRVLSHLWYSTRWLRPLLLLPAWILVVANAIFLMLAPAPCLDPQIKTRRQGTRFQSWYGAFFCFPLTAALFTDEEMASWRPPA